jgi:hypothetical protein
MRCARWRCCCCCFPRQYVYFCTSKTSKLRAAAKPGWPHTPILLALLGKKYKYSSAHRRCVSSCTSVLVKQVKSREYLLVSEATGGGGEGEAAASARSCRSCFALPRTESAGCRSSTCAYVSIRQHTSAYVSIRQHTRGHAGDASRCHAPLRSSAPL